MQTPTAIKGISVLALALASSASMGYAALPGAASTPAGAGFVGTCAGNEAFGGQPSPGSLYNPTSFASGSSYYDCNYQYSAVGGVTGITTSNSGTYFGYGWSNQSSSTAGPGQIHIGASNNATTVSDFAGATANGGWNENYTVQITDPSVTLTTPVSGFWVVPINFDGSLSVNNDYAYAQFSVGAYENGQELSSSSASAYSFFTANNAGINPDSSWMQVYYSVGGGGTGPLSESTSGTVLFALPVTFSSNTVTVNAGFYADVWISQSSGGPAIPTVETASFDHTVGWGGPGYLVLGGTTYQSNQFSVTGTSNFNYEAPFAETPEPGTMTALGFGFAGLVALRRRQQRV